MNSIPAGTGFHRLTKTQGTSTSETQFNDDLSGFERTGCTQVSVLYFFGAGTNIQYFLLKYNHQQIGLKCPVAAHGLTSC